MSSMVKTIQAEEKFQIYTVNVAGRRFSLSNKVKHCDTALCVALNI